MCKRVEARPRGFLTDEDTMKFSSFVCTSILLFGCSSNATPDTGSVRSAIKSCYDGAADADAGAVASCLDEHEDEGVHAEEVMDECFAVHEDCVETSEDPAECDDIIDSCFDIFDDEPGNIVEAAEACYVEGEECIEAGEPEEVCETALVSCLESFDEDTEAWLTDDLAEMCFSHHGQCLASLEGSGHEGDEDLESECDEILDACLGPACGDDLPVQDTDDQCVEAVESCFEELDVIIENELEGASENEVDGSAAATEEAIAAWEEASEECMALVDECFEAPSEPESIEEPASEDTSAVLL